MELGGAAENVIKAGTSNQLLYNDKEVILKENFLNLVYPVGSIYWSSNNTNPGTLFGGTWTQIKDRFILAAGDSYTNGATGGAATVTLTVSNMPSHSHSFTPSGTVGSHSHSFTPSGTVGSHTHSFTPSGTVGSHTHTGPSHTHSFTPSGTISTNGAHKHIWYFDIIQSAGHASDTVSANRGKSKYMENNTSEAGSHKHDFTGTAGTTGAAGTGNTGEATPSFTGTAGNTSETTPSFTGTAGNTSATTPSFTGTAGTTGANGSGSSFSILPPYVVKYCWERIA